MKFEFYVNGDTTLSIELFILWRASASLQEPDVDTVNVVAGVYQYSPKGIMNWSHLFPGKNLFTMGVRQLKLISTILTIKYSG